MNYKTNLTALPSGQLYNGDTVSMAPQTYLHSGADISVTNSKYVYIKYLIWATVQNPRFYNGT